MRREHLGYLVCPSCRVDLALIDAVEIDGVIESGRLECTRCAVAYPIVRHVPRFVSSENYARSFGLEWNRHARTQLDSFSGQPISERRFFAETCWPRNLEGEVVLEVGSGAGRFTEQAASTGAMVVSVDYSDAVDANHASNGNKPNVLVVQGDVFALPVRRAAFHRILCIGVLQHTPDPERAFQALPPLLLPGGELCVDVYRRVPGIRGRLMVKYWVRPLTRRLPPERLYAFTRAYVAALWPLTGLLLRVPYVGKRLVWLVLLVADYRGLFDLPEPLLKEWAVLDTFDTLSPAFDSPQTLEQVEGWFRRSSLARWEVVPGHNGIEGRGTAPS